MAWAAEVTLSSAQIKAGSGSTSYGTCSATDGGGNTWNAYAIKNQHSKATSDYNFWQIKAYANSTAYYVQVPTLGTKINSITITVSSVSQPRDGGGNSATLFFSSSNSTSAAGTGVVSGTGANSVTIDASSLDLNSGYITASGAVRIWDITVNYSTSSAPVAATGVSLNKESTSLYAGDSETLTATVAPVDATNKNVSWVSNNTSVAMVSDEGVVTAKAKGTATITVTTEDGSFTDDCVVTVLAAPVVSATFDFTDNSTWAFPISKTEGPNNYTNLYTITLQGSKDNGYYFDGSGENLLLGKSGATLTLPAFNFNVSKIKIYGDDAASGSVTFNVYVGDDAVSTAATSSKVTHDFAIAADKQAEGTVYVIKVTNANNMRISKIEIFGYKSVAVSGYEWATYSDATNALDFTNTDDVIAYMVTGHSGSALTKSQVTTTVPKNTGLLLNASEGTYSIPVIETSSTDVSSNKLKAGTGASVEEESGKTKYVLSVKDSKAVFKKIVGTAATVGAGKAYLQFDEVIASPVFDFDDNSADDQTTDISAIEHSTLNIEHSEVYNLNGQRVGQPTKGLYIVNGKKIVIK